MVEEEEFVIGKGIVVTDIVVPVLVSAEEVTLNEEEEDSESEEEKEGAAETVE